MIVISNSEIFDAGGRIYIFKGDEYEVEPEFSEEFYGKGSGIFYPLKQTGWKYNGGFYDLDTFTEKQEY